MDVADYDDDGGGDGDDDGDGVPFLLINTFKLIEKHHIASECIKSYFVVYKRFQRSYQEEADDGCSGFSVDA